MEEQRLDFSDYPAKEQEKDVFSNLSKQNRPQDIYVMRVNGDWGAVLPRKRHNVIFNADKGVELIEFVQNVKEDLQDLGINPRFHCVQNFGIESKIAEHQYDFKKLKEIREGSNDR